MSRWSAVGHKRVDRIDWLSTLAAYIRLIRIWSPSFNYLYSAFNDAKKMEWIQRVQGPL
jgi:hypothetical protein